ncbi:MAG: putative 2OG-Fe(II) oxygenase [Sphingomicrobium sp.]
MTVDALIRSVGAGQDGTEALLQLARSALAEGKEETALPFLLAAAPRRREALLWQWAGILQRALDEHADALVSFAEAAKLAPRDPSIALGRAYVALEAGVESIPSFELARRLAPADGQVLIGLNAARLAAGQAGLALADLDAVLDRGPLWIDGHRQYAQLRALSGDPASAALSLERALARHPDQTVLWHELCDLHVRREDYAQLLVAVGRALSGGQPAAQFSNHGAIAAGELGDPSAEQLLSAAAVDRDPRLRAWRLRLLLRSGRAAEVLPLIDQELRSERASYVWPYAALAWRMTGDPRHEWLAGDPRLVSVLDLAADLPPLAEMAGHLRDIHAHSGQYLDQSVRGGSQTDGPLLRRIDPRIRQLRAAIVAAVDRHVAQLPEPDPAHPTLGPPRDARVRFAGSWSVRLRGGGCHSNHVHPQGWISSALYVALPERGADEPADSGWLTLGEPQAELGLDLPPLRKIEPRPGQLVLFPSWMWHGTEPFAEGERLTVAFDVAMPG